jgi:hypothetical protein
MYLENEKMRSILEDHNERYPLWEMDDVYKLIHHASMGSEHAIRDEARVRDFLMTELAGLEPGPDEPMIDPISPDGQIMRIHLRPFLAKDLDPEVLLQAFITTAQLYPPSTDQLRKYADIAVQLAIDSHLPIEPDVFNEFINDQAGIGLPAVHHSTQYEDAYKPAYRVVARDVLSAQMIALGESR